MPVEKFILTCQQINCMFYFRINILRSFCCSLKHIMSDNLIISGFRADKSCTPCISGKLLYFIFSGIYYLFIFFLLIMNIFDSVIIGKLQVPPFRSNIFHIAPKLRVYSCPTNLPFSFLSIVSFIITAYPSVIPLNRGKCIIRYA